MLWRPLEEADLLLSSMEEGCSLQISDPDDQLCLILTHINDRFLLKNASSSKSSFKSAFIDQRTRQYQRCLQTLCEHAPSFLVKKWFMLPETCYDLLSIFLQCSIVAVNQASSKKKELGPNVLPFFILTSNHISTCR